MIDNDLSGLNELNERAHDRISKRKLGGQLYYPRARIDKCMPVQGMYEKKYPVGAVIHYTASGNSLYDIDHGKKKGLCYWLISVDGTVFQTASLDSWGWHAGISSHPTLGESLSRKLLGIEVDCPGRLDKVPQGWRTWYGDYIPNEKVNICADANGHDEGYCKFTFEQENALERLLVWLKLNNPTVFEFENVLGHSEISPRKTDPGGSLFMEMSDYRKFLQDSYRNELNRLILGGVI